MANRLYQQMNQPQLHQQPNQNNIGQLIGMIKNGGNPQQIMSMAAQQNPQVAQIMQELNSSGMSPKDFFMQKTQQMGINPDSILGMLR